MICMLFLTWFYFTAAVTCAFSSTMPRDPWSITIGTHPINVYVTIEHLHQYSLSRHCSYWTLFGNLTPTHVRGKTSQLSAIPFLFCCLLFSNTLASTNLTTLNEFALWKLHLRGGWAVRRSPTTSGVIKAYIVLKLCLCWLLLYKKLNKLRINACIFFSFISVNFSLCMVFFRL